MARKRKQHQDNTALPPPPPHVEGVVWGYRNGRTRREWLVPGAIPANRLIMLEGRKGTGKSLTLAAVAASITGGPLIPGWIGPRHSVILWESSEDDVDEDILPRVQAAGGSADHIGRIEQVSPQGLKRRLTMPDDLGVLEERISATGARVMILDPYISLAHPSCDCRTEQGARAYLDPLGELCRRLRVTCFLTRHLRKGNIGDPRDAGLGGTAVGNAARSILRCDEHPYEEGLYTLSVVTGSYGPRAPVQTYRIVGMANGEARVEWCGVSSLDIDQIAEGRGGDAQRDEWRDADRLLYLMVGTGWCRVKAIQSAGETAAVSLPMLRRAKTRLGIRTRCRQAGGETWHEWGPPERGWPELLVSPGEGGCLPPSPASPASPGEKPRKKRTLIIPGDAGDGVTHAHPPLTPLSEPEEGANGAPNPD